MKLIDGIFGNIFDKYHISVWNIAGRTEFGLDKRFLLFWRKPVTHHKVAHGTVSHEILTFATWEEACEEMEARRNK